MQLAPMKIFNKLTCSPHTVDFTKTTLAQKGIVEITKFFDQCFTIKLIEETLNIFEEKKQRKDIIMEQTENTPRNMFSVSQKLIHQSSKLIPNFYNNLNLLKFISNISQEKVMILPWEAERYLINGLSKPNDTQGWHWDDYSYALVFIAKATKEEEGGQLECIPNTLGDKGKLTMQEILNSSKPHPYFFDSGSFYLMKSDTTLHRVAPIRANSLRVSLVMSLCNENDLLKEINHETIYELYGV